MESGDSEDPLSKKRKHGSSFTTCSYPGCLHTDMTCPGLVYSPRSPTNVINPNAKQVKRLQEKRNKRKQWFLNIGRQGVKSNVTVRICKHHLGKDNLPLTEGVANDEVCNPKKRKFINLAERRRQKFEEQHPGQAFLNELFDDTTSHWQKICAGLICSGFCCLFYS